VPGTAQQLDVQTSARVVLVPYRIAHGLDRDVIEKTTRVTVDIDRIERRPGLPFDKNNWRVSDT